MTNSATQPRHARAEIRSFAKELKDGGWVYESVDSSGHTIWSHAKASETYTLPSTPSHFDVQRARREVARLIGTTMPGKRKKTRKPKRQRQDFVLARAKQSAPAPALPPAPRRPKLLPWEGSQADDRFNTALDRLMREVPGGRR